MWWCSNSSNNQERRAQEELERVWDLLRVRRSAVWPVADDDSSSSSMTKRILFRRKGHLTVDDFCLGRRIGKGSFGSVFLARKDDELFALKVIDRKKANGRARKERVAMTRLQHCDFTLTCRYAFQSFSKRYIVTDFYFGGSLEDQLAKKSGRCFEAGRAIFHGSEILLGIKGMHDYGVCHRDIKPSNILLDSRGHLVLGDFGFAKCGLAARSEYQETMRTFCGTVEYMAPEVLRGEEYGLMVDWWAFGITLYEMLCGQTPFYHQSPRKMFARILGAILPQNKKLTRSTLITIYQLLQKNPKTRCGYGLDDVAATPLFSGVDFRMVRARTIQPPFVVESPMSIGSGVAEPSSTTRRSTATPSSPVDFDAVHVVSF